MAKLLASYWRMPVNSGRTTKTAYLDLFDNGISANVVLFVDKFKLQIPKWVMRDFLSLGAVMYPEAAINRRANPERVLIEDVMKERLASAGYRYAPGRTNTLLPDARTGPDAALEHASRADLARAGDHNEVFRMILADIAAAEHGGSNLSVSSSMHKVRDDYGWTRFEVAASRWIQKTQREQDALRAQVAELEGGQ